MTDSQLLNNELNKLSPAQREKIAALGMENKVVEIAAKLALNDEQSRGLELEVMLAIVGLEERDDLEQNLIRGLGLTPETAKRAVEEIDNSIFKPLEDHFLELETKRYEEENDWEERFQHSPAEVQKAIANSDTETKITAIGQRHGLHVDQVGELADETGLVMLGLTHPDQFIPHLKSRLNLDENKAGAVAQDVNVEILSAIRESIKQLAAQPAETVFEQKLGKIFSLPKEEGSGTTVKPWDADPYLERP